MRSDVLLILAAFILTGTVAEAKFCDYRLSELIGGAATASAIGGSTAVAGSTVAMKAAGIYLITNATTGAAMVGSTAAGLSAAGTVGIIGGSGVLGGIAAVVTAPLTIAIAGIAAIGATAVEGGCFFLDERITDFDEVLALLIDVSKSMTPEHFQLHVPPRGEMSLADYEVYKTAAFINVLNEGGKFDRYQISKLYIVNGELLHRDWGNNTRIGRVAAAVVPAEPAKK